MPANDTVDLTNLVNMLQGDFVTWGTKAVMAGEAMVPAIAWLATTPIISTLDEEAIKAVLTIISKAAVMESFFLNTAIKKASQASDYVSAVTKRDALPETVSEEEYAAAEQKSIQEFTNLVCVSN